MPEIPHDVLTPLIGRATDLCDAGMELIDSLRAENGTGATMPESTLVRLHFVASSTYRSALLCLWMPETSLAAYGLTRGLLEIWAHLAFIADDASGGDARCRALRYERGALAEWSATMKKAPDSYDRDTWQVRHDERQRDVDALWDEFCCKGSPRTRSHVKSTLDSLSKQPTMGWIPGSGVLHRPQPTPTASTSRSILATERPNSYGHWRVNEPRGLPSQWPRSTTSRSPQQTSLEKVSLASTYSSRRLVGSSKTRCSDASLDESSIRRHRNAACDCGHEEEVVPPLHQMLGLGQAGSPLTPESSRSRWSAREYVNTRLPSSRRFAFGVTLPTVLPNRMSTPSG